MIFDSRIRLIMITAAVQTAKSLILELALSHVIANDPGPAMWINQDDDEAKDEATTRLYPLLDGNPAFSHLLPPKHKRRKDFIQFLNGMPLWMMGAVISNLQRRSIRWMFGDEWWLWKDGFIEEARTRLKAFGWLSKGVFASQGGHEECEGHKLISLIRQQDWGWVCPECGLWQPWSWDYIGGFKEGRPGLSWDHCKTADGLGYDEDLVRRCTVMVCRSEQCGSRVDDTDRDRRRLGRASRFEEVAPGGDEVGLHWNVLPFDSWGDLAVQYLRAKYALRVGDSGPMMRFVQKKMANKWTDVPEDFTIELQETGYRMRDDWVDEGGLVATRQGFRILEPPFPEARRVWPLRVMLVDRQQDHLFAAVLSFAGVRCRVRWAQGGLGADGLHSYDDLEQIQEKDGIHPSLVFVDARWDTRDVYTECARRGWTALMGEDRSTFPHRIKDEGVTVHRFYSPVRKVPLGGRLVCRMHFFSNLNCKDTVARALSSGMWTLPDDAPKGMKDALESEQRKLIGKKPMWVQIGKRPNHYWDCLSMGAAASYMLKLSGDDGLRDGVRE